MTTHMALYLLGLDWADVAAMRPILLRGIADATADLLAGFAS